MTGTFSYNTDRKGRVVCPALFREELGNPLALCLATPMRLLLTSRRHWDACLSSHVPASALQHSFEVTAAATTGRILLPATVRQMLDLAAGDEVVWSGCGNVAMGAPRYLCPPDLALEPPPWAHARRSSSRVPVPRGTVLLALSVLTGLEGADARAVRETLEACCG
jgi:hypothetical protein